ncbi:hypothetical protein HWI79_1168 [Cryptosporidium felis]|nr:hypothetical protein HWI79_1168 [Cryptosporidium felis]
MPIAPDAEAAVGGIPIPDVHLTERPEYIWSPDSQHSWSYWNPEVGSRPAGDFGKNGDRLFWAYWPAYCCEEPLWIADIPLV